MIGHDGVAAGPERRLLVAELGVLVGEGRLSIIGLGSCVAIVLADPGAHIGGMAHVMLPDETMARDRSRPGKFPRSAIAALLRDMTAAGADRRRVRARLVGGASMFASLLAAGGLNIGQRNVVAARAALRDAAIPLVGEDVGGDYGRSVSFDVASGIVEVRSLRHDPHVL